MNRKRTSNGPIAADGADELVASAPRLLKALHLMNADGTVSADKRRKLKQAAHIVGLFRPEIEDVCRRKARPVVWDLNCGSSYVSLLLAHDVRTTFGKEIDLVGVDLDPARVDACRKRAAAAGFPDATFVHGDVASAPLPDAPDLALSLHGCDTASDHALLRAVRARARHVSVAPCCHRELRGLLKRVPPHDAFLVDGAVADEYAALLTDVSRAALLKSAGYRADVVAFVPAEHSPKNRLVRGVLVGKADLPAARFLREVSASCKNPPTFCEALRDQPEGVS